MTKIEADRTLVTSREQLPDFDAMGEDEQMEYWETHDFAEGVLESGPEVEEDFFKLLTS